MMLGGAVVGLKYAHPSNYIAGNGGDFRGKATRKAKTCLLYHTRYQSVLKFKDSYYPKGRYISGQKYLHLPRRRKPILTEPACTQ